MRILSASLLALALCSCAATNQNADAARNVCAIAFGDPALNPIRGRIPFEDDAAVKASMEYLTDNGRPNQAERAALQQLDAAYRRCWDAWDKARVSPYAQAARTKVSASLSELYAGKATYGDFNRQRATAISEMRAAEAQAAAAQSYPYGTGGSPVTFGLGLGFFR